MISFRIVYDITYYKSLCN